MVTLLAIVSVSIIWTRYFEPLQTLIEWSHNPKVNQKNIILKALRKLLTCSKCLSFWLTLIITGSFPIAITIALITIIIDKQLN
jgi:hypothetical protein